MNNTVPTPDPAARLISALDPRGDIDLGLAVTIANDLSGDAVTVLAELVDKRVHREVADAYDRGWSEAGGKP